MLGRRVRLLAHPQAWPTLVGIGLGLLALGPALGPGYVLSYDMVFLPHPPISAATIGLAGGPPRAVPSDAVIAVLSAVAPADLVQKVILIAIFAAACAGAANLLAHCAARTGRCAPPLARLAAGVFYAWNPFVAERLILGHWALLLGYAGLPWVVASVQARDRPLRLGRLAAALIPATVGGFAALGITGLAAVPVAAAGRSPTRGEPDRTGPIGGKPDRTGPIGGKPHRTDLASARRVATVLVALGVASLPWLIPSLLVSVHTDPSGADAFAARADTPFGRIGSLLMLGGVWNQQVVPSGYGGIGSAAWLLVVLVAVTGYALLGWRARACPGLGIAGLAGLAVAALGVTAPSRAALRHLIAAWPGFAVLRDGQQYAAPLALAEAIGIGLVVAWVATELAASTVHRPATGRRDGDRQPGPAGRRAATALAVMAAIAPVLLLPGLAWGAAGRLHPTAYPADWLRARQVIDGDRRPGAVVLLPWAAYRRYGWNGGRAVLDPWTKLLRRPVIWNDALRVGDQTVAAEDPAARRLNAALSSTGPLTATLRSAGVRYVVVDSGPLLRRRGLCLASRARLPGATVLIASGDLMVFRLPRSTTISVAADRAKPSFCTSTGR
jgi:hypothetical protein